MRLCGPTAIDEASPAAQSDHLINILDDHIGPHALWPLARAVRRSLWFQVFGHGLEDLHRGVFGKYNVGEEQPSAEDAQYLCWITQHDSMARDPCSMTTSAITYLEQLSELELDEATAVNQVPPALMKPNQDICQELGRLLSSAWFHRVWIVQEVVLARRITIQYGKEQIAWNRFIKGCQFAMANLQVYQTMFNPSNALRLHDLRCEYQLHGPLPDLLHALKSTKHSLSTMEVDKVYSLIGLTNEQLEVDYSEPALDTFLRFAQTTIAKREDLALLNLVEDQGFRYKNRLPTWVPDWEVHHGPRPFANGAAYSGWKPSTSKSAKALLLNEGRILQTHGFVVDRVKYIGMAFLEQTPLSGGMKSWAPGSESMWIVVNRGLTYRLTEQWAIERVQNWHGLAEKYATMFEAGGERHSAFLLTLVAGDITRDLLRTNTCQDGMARLSQGFDLFCNVWRISTKGNFAAAF
ncbi:hypothetical protein LTR24_005918 [Lithohypha guttulata]|uniref:Heterokaryon incompatibility domain-containing protein n=1 Tax=Lithohypha guttulata TaxID=1690604 RepID=A0ABR0K7X4_9EURO|nr:hypothetical protein LTR24_005918 [Lithohypha guttulata]